MIKENSFKLAYSTRLSITTQRFLSWYGHRNPLNKPIFIIGLNRSGTTILTKLFSKHKDLINWTEANEVWDPIGYPFEKSQIDRPFWSIDPKGYTESVLNSVSLSYFEAIPGLFSMYVQSKKENHKEQLRFLNKSPMNTTRIELLYKLFPDAYFLSTVRDPRAVIRSWLNKICPKLEAHPSSGVEKDDSGKIEIFNISGTRYTYLEMIEIMANSYNYVITKQLEDLVSLPEKQVFHTCYEDLTNQVHGIIQKIDDKFDLDSNLREWSQIPETLESKNYKYQEEFSKEELAIITNVCAPIMKRLRYQK